MVEQGEAPILSGVEDLTISSDKPFNLLQGVPAYDFEGNDLTSKIEVIHNTIDIDEVGNYEVTYQLKDEQGATATLRIEVEV
ncbi:immunoglobulin-like domain-containing protein [Turicibacter sp. TJ11]|uniref:immunoglobulin-like domain-containing protein n=1 Tax=Turicibacter sp. TJ11 TaxID=2806443 RepID=UPI001F48BB92|nr:immunoglobulin-like domain-containing protein [Turicibacter sp. TJ11]